MYVNLYQQYLEDFNNMINNVIAPIREAYDEYMQQIQQVQTTIKESLEQLNEIMRENRERIVEYLEYLSQYTDIHQEVAASYDYVTDVDVPDSPIVEDSPSRSPPKKTFKQNIEIWYIYLMPMFLRIIMYLEGTILSNYIFELLKFIFQYIGVYL